MIKIISRLDKGDATTVRSSWYNEDYDEYGYSSNDLIAPSIDPELLWEHAITALENVRDFRYAPGYENASPYDFIDAVSPDFYDEYFVENSEEVAEDYAGEVTLAEWEDGAEDECYESALNGVPLDQLYRELLRAGVILAD